MTPIKINNEYTVEITDLTFRGKGVSKIDDFTVFVDKSVPGDVVKIKIYDVKKTYAHATLIEIVSPSEHRSEILDERLDTIPLQHLKYHKQLEYKRKWLYDTLKRSIDIKLEQIEDTIGMKDPWYYRNKAQIPTRMIDGQLETGIFKSESNTLVPVENYYIQDK
ncbi:MAG TPA: TRAM domain-containing protein, partial [Erysipelothrix sp.]|nr:TRAM domain-containing protein [Erysipelothrix sp.]